MDPVARQLFDFLSDAIHNPEYAYLNEERLPAGFRELGQGLQFYVHCVREASNLAAALANGDLNTPLPSTDNPLAAPLKALHATLRHMTWQTQQVAKGDYQQRMAFMGEFSNAFNTMVEQLQEQRSALLDEIETSHRKVNSLVQSNKLLVSITGQILQWIVVVDRRTMDWLFVSREIDEALHDPNSHGQLLRWMNRQAQALGADEESANAELELTGRYGTQFFSVTVYPLHWHARSALAFVLTDVSSEKQHLCRLQEAAWYDTLTKVYNRFYGMEVLERWLKERADFVLCFVDIDNLKVVNDGFGHREGDHYILDIARGLQEFSEDAIVCRIGGDEFLLLAKGWRAEAAGTRMEELRSALVSRGKQTERAYERGMSYGIVAVEADCTLTAEQLLGLADERMYEYKRLHSCGPEAAPKAKQ